MFLTTRGRYATRAMIHLAEHYGGPPIPVADIAASESLSEKYLQQLLGTLRRAGLVRVVMGPHGGFELARPPREVSLAAILRSVEGDIALCECVLHESVCTRISQCKARCVWCAATRALTQFLEGHTLENALQPQPCEPGPAAQQPPAGVRKRRAAPARRGAA